MNMNEFLSCIQLIPNKTYYDNYGIGESIEHIIIAGNTYNDDVSKYL